MPSGLVRSSSPAPIQASPCRSSYAPDGHNAHSVRQLLAPVEQTASLCGMRFVEPFVIYGALDVERRHKMEGCISSYRARVEALRDGLDPEARA